MKCAHVLWKELNASRYNCEVCRFRSFNKAHYARHVHCDKHFLLTHFRWNAPRDIKILVASFLPLYKIIRLRRVGPCALRLAWKRPFRYSNFPRVLLPDLIFGPPHIVSLPVQTSDGVAWTVDNGHIRPYAVIL
jgi:hypothetical protein